MTFTQISRHLSRNQSDQSFVLFRASFALILAFYIYRYFLEGKIETHFLKPTVHFGYFPGLFDVPLFSAAALKTLYLSQILGLALLGFGGRLATLGAIHFVATFGYFFLIDTSYYNNHDYLFMVIGVFFIFLPSRSLFQAAKSLPNFYYLTFKTLLIGVYFYAFVAKLDPSWFSGEVPAIIVDNMTSYPHLEGLILWCGKDLFTYMLTFGGLIADGILGPLLLWKRTRVFAAIVLGVFHLSNSYLLNIGPFPFIMIASFLLFFHDREMASESHMELSKLKFGVCLAMLFFQLVLPLRPFVYRYPATWYFEAYRFSWRMMSFDKYPSRIDIAVQDQTGQSYNVDPSRHLIPLQVRQLGIDPQYTLQYANYLKSKFQKEFPDREFSVRVAIDVSFNSFKNLKFISQDDLTQFNYALISDFEWVEKYEK